MRIGPWTSAIGLDRETHQFLACQRSRGGAGFGDEGFEIRNVVRAGMQFQIGKQLALGFGELLGARLRIRCAARSAEARRGSRSAATSSASNEAFFLERLQHRRARFEFSA